MRFDWIILILAGLCEVGFTFCLGKADALCGRGRILWLAGFVAFYTLSAVLLARATRSIPVGTAYPVWTGIGAAGAVLLGILAFREAVSFWRIFFLVTLVVSVVGLRAVS